MARRLSAAGSTVNRWTPRSPTTCASTTESASGPSPRPCDTSRSTMAKPTDVPGGQPTSYAETAPANSASTTTAHVEVSGASSSCLLYTSDAADDLLCVDLGGRRI